VGSKGRDQGKFEVHPIYGLYRPSIWRLAVLGEAGNGAIVYIMDHHISEP